MGVKKKAAFCYMGRLITLEKHWISARIINLARQLGSAGKLGSLNSWKSILKSSNQNGVQPVGA